MNFFKEYKKQMLILLAIIVSITAVIVVGKKSNSSVVNNTLGVIVTPLQKIATDTVGWFDQRISSLKDDTDLVKENQELKAKIALLESDNHRLSLYEQENEKLSSLLEIAQKYPEYTTVGANVIGKDPGNWYNVFMIDKGSKDGLLVNMVVMDQGGIVGKIIEVNYNNSKVQSILDNKSSVPSISLRTDDIGVVRGDYTLLNDGLCKMEYIDANSEIMIGDEIVTSNLSDVYPPGLTVGYVKDIVTDANDLTKYATIESSVDFKHLSTVLVLTDTKAQQVTEEEGV